MYNYQKIKRSTIIMSIAYFLITVSVFSSLANVGIQNAVYVSFASIPGYILLTIGLGLIRKESNFFKASFIVTLFIDFISMVFISVTFVMQYVAIPSDIIEKLNITLEIFQALLNALIAVSSCLFAGGLVPVFSNLNNKKMKTYSWIMRFSISKLVILSVALPTVKITKISAMTITCLTIVVDLIIQISLLVFTILVSYNLDCRKRKGANKN